MRTLSQIKLPQAESIFAVANTPNFLLRKLRADPAVQEIGRTFSGDDIMRELKAVISVKPTKLHDAARPYAYLVALSYNEDISYLKKATRITAKRFDWFQHIARVLVESHKPTLVKSFDVLPQTVASPQVSSKVVTPISHSIIEVEK